IPAVRRAFCQVDVFTEVPYRGNPVAVVLDGRGLSQDEMQRFARWTNLSETPFVPAPTGSGADSRVCIFTPSQELPFAGHPTLGTCHAWLTHGGTPHRDDTVVQECDAGLIELARADAVLAVSPGVADLDIGVVGPYPPGSPEAFEVRAFTPAPGGFGEDPVTG